MCYHHDLTEKELRMFPHPEELFDRWGQKIGPRQKRLLRMYVQQNGQCYYCGKFMFLWWKLTGVEIAKQKNMLATVEHLQPKSKNGKNALHNLRAACQFCNYWRANRPIEEFLDDLRQKPRSNKIKEHNRTNAKNGCLKYVQKTLTPMYTLFWMNCFRHPELSGWLDRLPRPNAFAKELAETLQDCTLPELHVFTRHINAVYEEPENDEITADDERERLNKPLTHYARAAIIYLSCEVTTETNPTNQPTAS